MVTRGHAGDLMVRAVLFDLDGTLLDTLDDLTASVNAALRGFGYPPRSRDEVRTFVGNGVRKLMERAVPADCKDFDAVYQAFRAHYSAHCADATQAYPGVPELLETLKARGVKLGIVSNKMDPAVKSLCARYFGKWVSVAIGESAAVRKKPAPDTVLQALRELGAAPAQAVYVGDSDVDLKTAKNAGIPCISVSWGFRSEDFLRRHGAQTIVGSTAELLHRLEQDER